MDTNKSQDNLVDTKGLLLKCELAEGMTLVDCGAGNAAPFTLAGAEIVGERGTVYALDVVKSVLASIKQRVEKAGFLNVVTVWTDLEIVGAAKRVASNSADVLVIADTLSQSHQKEEVLKEAMRMVKTNGKILLVDWKKSSPLGPEFKHRISSADLKVLAESLNLQHLETFDAGDYHWAMILQK
ncbi:MAG: hypothetical protein A2233_01420 [Candidatus Kerfeldbacteria bacterium RIFOXYA2_FULL_38_24]|uniref:Methyltransferase domain-containing protein n=1 Tax=Candidatus Kerfeldbacteria bacterium RIFOXYB2_FULL_38_14 TaxID=1798547 RepID=A0A1G2BE23_9BACT|nr:MAG: hypothetical protein A2233_01420 [Candidatus Kerfeldbacteria bacterium RIFOXYA2_FULL_38_24]OGY87394.1 MAG: hypothetical protein A2319_05510 [Candidatus Kerfeldbacteria bacterium RIFOXYB2_FULL_38_14]OGY90345.1 MAG: hypothetical protein A2458_04415 [Candidatus Kerfeldbacteria bacterium RIFOXYC2_FULL_38_9]